MAGCSTLKTGAAQWCCPSTQGIEARRVGVCVVAAKWGQSWVAALEQEGLQLGIGTCNIDNDEDVAIHRCLLMY